MDLSTLISGIYNFFCPNCNQPNFDNVNFKKLPCKNCIPISLKQNFSQTEIFKKLKANNKVKDYGKLIENEKKLKSFTNIFKQTIGGKAS